MTHTVTPLRDAVGVEISGLDLDLWAKNILPLTD